MVEKLKERYLKHYIRDDQLDRYVALGVITQEQAEEIKMVKITGGGASSLTLYLPGGLRLVIPREVAP